MAERTSPFIRLLEKILVFYIIANPFIDILTGFYICEFLHATELDIINATFSSTPGLIIRMAILLVFGLYLLLKRDRIAIGTLFIMGLAWCASIAMLLVGGTSLSLSTDVKYFVKYCYNIAMLFAYLNVFKSLCSDRAELLQKLDRLITYTCIVYSLGIIIPYIFHLGYSTYADRLGYRGCRGYFYSGNDVTAVFVVLLPIAMANLLSAGKAVSRSALFARICAPAVAIVSLLVIGSKTAFISVIGTSVAISAFCLFSGKGKRKLYLKRLLLMFAAAIIVFLTLTLLVGGQLVGDIGISANAPLHFADNESVETAMLSGRGEKLREQLKLFADGGITAWLFGIGRSSVVNIIEMDLAEVLIYYGAVGAAAMLWLYIWLAFDFLKNLFRNFNIVSFALFFGIGMTFGYMLIAGHVLFSVTSGQYFIFAIALSRVYFAESCESAAIRPKLLTRLLRA